MDSENWRSDMIPPEVFRDWLQGKYLLGARRSAENAALGWSLMLRGVYKYSVYIPKVDSTGQVPDGLKQYDDPYDTYEDSAWSIQHCGYCHIRLDDGELVLRGLRIFTEDGKKSNLHHPIYWTSTLTKLETRDKYLTGQQGKGKRSDDERAQCSFIYKLADVEGPDYTYDFERQKLIQERGFKTYEGGGVTLPPEGSKRIREPYSISDRTKERDLLDHIRSEDFPDEVNAFHQRPDPLFGLVVIDLLPPGKPDMDDQGAGVKNRQGPWTLTGQYQQMQHRLSQGKWGRIYFTRVGGLRQSDEVKG